MQLLVYSLLHTSNEHWQIIFHGESQRHLFLIYPNILKKTVILYYILCYILLFYLFLLCYMLFYILGHYSSKHKEIFTMF